MSTKRKPLGPQGEELLRELAAGAKERAELAKRLKALPPFAFDPSHPPTGDFVLSEDGTRWEPKP